MTTAVFIVGLVVAVGVTAFGIKVGRAGQEFYVEADESIEPGYNVLVGVLIATAGWTLVGIMLVLASIFAASLAFPAVADWSVDAGSTVWSFLTP
jgi:hypothetical protein